MVEQLEVVAKLAVLVFVISCMAAAGLKLGIRDIVAPFRRTRLVAAAVVANFFVVPAIAYALTEVVALDQPYRIGLLLLGCAAGAPFLPKLAELAKGDQAYSVGLMLLLMVGSVAFMPVALPLLVPGLSPAIWPLLSPLLFTMLLPLVAGMAVRARSERWSSRVRPAFEAASNVSVVLAIALLIGLSFRSILGMFGSGVIAVAGLFVLLAFVVGYAFGWSAPGTRSVLGLGTGQRNIAAALIVATHNLSDPDVAAMLLVSTLAGLVVLLPIARWAARTPPDASPAEPAGPRAHDGVHTARV